MVLFVCRYQRSGLTVYSGMGSHAYLAGGSAPRLIHGYNGAMDSVLINKAYWRSRRGMQELDVLLIPFVENHLQTLSAELQSAYLRFIDCEDWELFDWLQGREDAEDPQFRELIARILEPAS